MGKRGIQDCEHNPFAVDYKVREKLGLLIANICNNSKSNSIDIKKVKSECYDNDKVNDFIESNEYGCDADRIEKVYMNQMNKPEKFFNSTCAYGTIDDATFETLHSAEGTKKYICDALKKFADFSLEFMEGDSREMKSYMFKHNSGLVSLAANFDQALKDQGIQLPPEVDKLYKNMKGSLDALAHCQVAFDMSKNPINLVLPEKEGLGQIILENQAEILKQINNDKDLKEAFGELDIANCVKEAAESMIKTDAYEKDIKARKDLMKNTNTKQWHLAAQFTLDGNDITYAEAIKAHQEGKDVHWRPTSKQEKAALKEALKPEKLRHTDPDKAIACGEAKFNKAKTAENINKYFEKITQVADKLSKTNSIFSKDSKEYKNISMHLNSMAKQYKAIQADIKKNGVEANYDKLKKLMDDTKRTREVIPVSAKKYIEVRDAKNKEKVSNRGIQRMNVLKEIEGIEPPKTGIDYINDQPKVERVKVDRAKIDRELQAKNQFEQILETTKAIEKNIEYVQSFSNK